MLFRRIVVIALLSGLAGGLALSLIQRWQVIPIITAAEQLESQKVEVAGSEESDHSGHSHDHEEWGPEDGLERILFTMLSNVLTAIGYALLLVALGAAASIKYGKMRMSLASGLVWGLGGFIAFFAAPSLGILPQLPGVAGAALESRQFWWISTVLCTGAGLFLAHVLKTNWRWVGAAVLLVVPHLFGAPQADDLYAGHTADMAAQLSELSGAFLAATGISSLIMWLVIGGCTGFGLDRFLLKEASRPKLASART